jgi:peptidoglycan/LPS O-acetylase OafA/YrhL
LLVRNEKIIARRRDGQAKVLGILVCVIGATILTLYRGPTIFDYNTPKSPLPDALLGALFSVLRGWEIDEWKLGALCLIGCCSCIGLFVNIQVPPNQSLSTYPCSQFPCI